jgi:hypothetical protein
MMKHRVCLLLVMLSAILQAQNFPWKNALRMAWSADGATFNSVSIFQDSSGVPCVIRWKGDTLAAVFQWFRLPNPSPSWDRVAIKFSYDNGQSWTNPAPIVFSGLPPGFQRPFDPALTVFNGDSLRIYFSSSAGMPMGLDSTVNTYSAKSANGINFVLENNARVDVATKPVIDPSVIYFNNGWHYLAPVGAPQEGAYHYISPNGINFSAVPVIPSDNSHNWTGNYMIDNAGTLRFYGGGPGNIWYDSSPNGGTWNGFVNTNIQGGDPSVVKISASSYLMIYVGPPFNTTELQDPGPYNFDLQFYPNPVSDQLRIAARAPGTEGTYTIFDSQGSKVKTGQYSSGDEINVAALSPGTYILALDDKKKEYVRFVKN